MAVMLNILEFKKRPWDELQAIATDASQYIAEHGDDILFKSRKEGDTAIAFNMLAKGIAVLSFAPGGVNIFGLHFEAVHPESLEKGSRWLYHSTFVDELPRIADRGLVPDERSRRGGQLADWSQGKVFLTETVDQAGRYAASVFRELLENQGWTWDPILLRVHSAHLADVAPDPHSFADWFVERKIPWTFIQVWVPHKDAWIEVREAQKQRYFDEFQTNYGEPGELNVGPNAEPQEYARQYIEQFWPKG